MTTRARNWLGSFPALLGDRRALLGIAIDAVLVGAGLAMAAGAIGFAGLMVAEGNHKPEVYGLKYLGIYAQPRWTPEQVALVGRLRSLIARFEETRELRLMGGYTPGGDPVLDQAVKTVPRIYEAMMQSLSSPSSLDPFIDLATALRNGPKSGE